MASERKKYIVSIAGIDYVFQGVAYLYDEIKDELGVRSFSESDLDGTGFADNSLSYSREELKKNCPRLTVVLEPDTAVAGGNAAQQDSSNKTRRVEVFCDPENVEDALTSLPRKNIDGFGTAGGNRKITKVYFKRQLCYK